MWDLAQLLKPRLEERGIQVRLTKSRVDQAVGLVPRGKLSEGADLFISLHSNAASTKAPDWVLVLHQVADACGTVDARSRGFAELLAPEVAALMGVGHQLRSVKSSADRDANGYADDYYGVLRGAHTVGTPGVIIEHGFHTNEKCTRWLREEENLKKLADAEAAVIARWFDIDKAQEPREPEHWYRIRKSWADAASQTGAFRSLENAKNACPEGYCVYDRNGEAVYARTAEYTQTQFLRELQAAIGVTADGAAGLWMLSKTPTISAVKNNRHPAVLPVQKRLYALGYTQVGEADGIAGPLFTAAVKAYQKASGCVTDGEITAGERTWRCLLGLQ